MMEFRFPSLLCGVAGRPLPGQQASGDAFWLGSHGDATLVAMVDGLGHGPEAAEAADVALRTLGRSWPQPLEVLFARCHEALKSTRGVAMTLAAIDARADTLTWFGVGNVEGILRRAGKAGGRDRVRLRGGVVGYLMPPLHLDVVSLRAGDIVAFATDGLASAFGEGLRLDRPPLEAAEQLLGSYAKPTDDALVLVARYLGEGA